MKNKTVNDCIICKSVDILNHYRLLYRTQSLPVDSLDLTSDVEQAFANSTVEPVLFSLDFSELDIFQKGLKLL